MASKLLFSFRNLAAYAVVNVLSTQAQTSPCLYTFLQNKLSVRMKSGIQLQIMPMPIFWSLFRQRASARARANCQVPRSIKYTYVAPNYIALAKGRSSEDTTASELAARDDTGNDVVSARRITRAASISSSSSSIRLHTEPAPNTARQRYTTAGTTTDRYRPADACTLLLMNASGC